MAAERLSIEEISTLTPEGMVALAASCAARVFVRAVYAKRGVRRNRSLRLGGSSVYDGELGFEWWQR